MNQTINQLKQRAGINDNPDQEGLDLFAKLIVEECLEQLEYSPLWVKEKINAHFGVKE